MSDLAVGAIKSDAITLYREEGFTGYTVTLTLKQGAVTKSLTGAIDGTNPKLYHIATTQVSDLPTSGTWNAQAQLVGGGDDFPTAPFDIYIHPVV